VAVALAEYVQICITTQIATPASHHSVFFYKIKIPAATSVDECTSADTGVGTAIAAGNQLHESSNQYRMHIAQVQILVVMQIWS